MSTGWTDATVDDIKADAPNALATGPFGSSISSRFFQEHGVPVIRGSNLSDRVGDRLVHDKLVFISKDLAAKFHRSIARRGDLVFTCWGTIGQVGLIDKRCPYEEYVVSNKQMKLTPNPTRADSLFMYYAFSGPEVSSTIKSQAIGSSVPGFNLGQLRGISLRLPPLPEQKAIARVLGALDDKIELNRRMNETLEATARAIFKSWFVDFDPVRAKAEGRAPPGLDPATAALFPDSFEDSPLGEIPAGWRAGTLGDVAENPRRPVRPTELAPGTPYIGLEHMPMRSTALGEWGYAEAVTSGKSRFARGEILFGKLRPYFHKVGVAAMDGVCSTDILVIRPLSPPWFGFVLATVSSTAFVDYTDASSTGTKMPRTNWKDMSWYELALPPAELAEQYTRTIRPTADRIVANIWESRTLAAIRDALLPKLLSGELGVEDAERPVGREPA